MSKKLDFDNLKPDDLRKLTKEDISKFSGEQFIKYKEALDKYKGLVALSEEPTTLNNFMSKLGNVMMKTDNDTKLEIRIKDEDGSDKVFVTNHCTRVKYYKHTNTLEICNYD